MPSSARQGGGLREGYEIATWAREREILALQAEVHELKRQLALVGLNLLEISGAMEHALRDDRPQSVMELRRMVSRIKGMV